MFDRSLVTVRNVQEIAVASKTRYRLKLDSCCLVICRCTAYSTLALAHRCRYARTTV